MLLLISFFIFPLIDCVVILYLLLFENDEEDRLKAYYDPETETVRNVNEDIEVFEEYNDKHTFKNK